MTLVKGSKQYAMVVVRQRPWIKWLAALAVTFALLLTAGGGYWLGIEHGRPNRVADVAGDGSAGRLAQVEEENLSLRQQVANLKLGSEVDRKASESVRLEVMDLKNQIAALEEDISFYRGLMSPSENSKGLAIGSLSLLQAGKPGLIDYKLVVQQLATRHELLNGTLKFNILGRREGKPMTFALKDVSEEVDSVNIKLRFKYFQAIEGTLQLPANFEPQGIELVASTSGKNSVVIKKNFGWLVEER